METGEFAALIAAVFVGGLVFLKVAWEIIKKVVK